MVSYDEYMVYITNQNSHFKKNRLATGYINLGQERNNESNGTKYHQER